MPTVIVPYKPRPQLKPYHATKKRFRALEIHRQMGKTVAALNQLIKTATTDPEVLAKERGITFDAKVLAEWRSTPRTCGYIAPFFSQAKSIAWDKLKFFAGAIPGTTVNEAELRVDFPGGGRVRLFGSDNLEALRGLTFWEVVLDEFQDHRPGQWREVILPTCIMRRAPITFIGTTKGKGNQMYQIRESHKDDPDWFTLRLPVTETGVIPLEVLEKEKALMTEAKFNQEYMLEPYASIEGSIFGKEMMWLQNEEHITHLEEETLADVDTYWDLGIADYLVVLFMQRVGREHRIIDCYYTNNTSLAEVVKVLSQKGYSYGTHYLPHDAKQRESITGMSREDFLKGKLQGNIHVVPRVAKIEDAIMAVKLHYKKLWINESLETLVEALYHYSMEYDDERKVWKNIPKHDWTSHFVSALEGWAMVETTRIHSEVVPSSYDTPIFIDQTHYAPDDVRL